MIQWSTNTILCWLRFGCMKTVPIEIFFAASMPVYLYPFLNTMNCERNYECLRLTSLGVIGTLAKVVLPHIFWSSLVLVSGRTLSLIWNFEYSYTQNKYIIRAHGVELILFFLVTIFYFLQTYCLSSFQFLQVDDAEVVDYLLSTQIFPSCLRCMEVGRTLSKTVSDWTFLNYRNLQPIVSVVFLYVLSYPTHPKLRVMVKPFSLWVNQILDLFMTLL